MMRPFHKKLSLLTLSLTTMLVGGIISCVGNTNRSENFKKESQSGDSLIKTAGNSFPDDISRYISGMRQTETNVLATYEKSNSWKKYSELSDSSWAKLRREKINIMSDWSKNEIAKQGCKPETVFYPFSGPDFLHAVTLFPEAKNYILIGLEAVGSIPTYKELQKDSLKGYFQAVERSLRDVLNFSFFKTNNMAVDLKGKDIDGSLPLLFIFLERTGNRILSIDTISFAASEVVSASKNKNTIKGVKIRFSEGGEEKNLYYFSADLTDYVLQKHESFLNFLSQFKNMTCFLKSASYLMYRPNFSLIKNTILSGCNYILEDDSGIPYKAFEEGKWNLQFYGHYMVPIYLFTHFYDVPLHERFKKEAKALPFGIGYHWRKNESNLIFAIKKQI
jgi:hypothetical protein